MAFEHQKTRRQLLAMHQPEQVSQTLQQLCELMHQGAPINWVWKTRQKLALKHKINAYFKQRIEFNKRQIQNLYQTTQH